MRGIAVNRSGIQGTGVFAARNFKKGETVVSWNAHRCVPRNKVCSLSVYTQNHLEYIGNGTYMVMLAPERYINHSCTPNTYVRNRKDIALRNIAKGEEISTDYSLNSFDTWVLQCRCGAKTCRGKVHGDFRKLSPKLQKHYWRYLEPWFKKELQHIS